MGTREAQRECGLAGGRPAWTALGTQVSKPVTTLLPHWAVLDNECVFFLHFFCRELPAVP